MINKDAKQKTIIVILFILLLIVLCIPLNIVFTSASIFDVGVDYDPVDPSSFNKTGIYKIDTNTILKSIDSNQSQVFLPDTTIILDSKTNNELAWTQTEYLKIGVALFEFVWKESLDSNWNIHKMSFRTSCMENPAGFESATFVFNQLIFQHGRFEYNARAIDISPLDGNVSWGGDIVLPRPIRGANAVDLDKLKITADEALSVAEENGGNALRQSVQNDCRIHLSLDEDWRVVYYSGSKKYLPTLEIDIDPYTGKIITSR